MRKRNLLCKREILFLQDSMYLFDLKKAKNYSFIIGIDESGRGSLAGPVYAAAVILNLNSIDHYFEVFDCKQISSKKRALLFKKIKENAFSFSRTFISNKIIDEKNIVQASSLAMKDVLLKILSKKKLDSKNSQILVLIDGVNKIEKFFSSQEAFLMRSCSFLYIKKGDQKSASIAAASIVAKYSRDCFMINLHSLYPHYDFNQNKGYGTSKHFESIKKYKLSPYHRKTFYPCFNYAL